MKITFFENIFSPSLYSSLVVISVLCILVIIVGSGIKKIKPTDKPKGIYMALELLVDFINKFSKQYFGKYWRTFAPYILTLGTFLAVSNASGMFGLRPPTASVNVTFSLALITFLMIHIGGMVTQGVGAYLKGFTKPLAPLLPLNLIGELALPISLSLRLFGNILSGLILSSMVYAALGWFSPAVTPIIHAIFDIFFGLIQTLVFVLLSTIFISGQLALDE